MAARELKNRLGKYLKRVRRGESVVVTDRGVPIAELRPVRLEKLSLAARLERMAEAGDLTLPAASKSFVRAKAIIVKGRPVSASLSEDRG